MALNENMVDKFRMDMGKKIFDESGETQEEGAWKGGGCPIPGDIQD